MEQRYYPPRLPIDELGWSKFLTQWASEATELSRQLTLLKGIEGYSEDYAKDLEKDLNIPVPKELYQGGFEYPPKTEADRQRCRVIFAQAEAIVKTSLVKDPNSYQTFMIQNDYEYWALMGADKLLSPPASKEAIAATEQRLGITLPPSYKGFLQASNGFWVLPKSRLMPVQDIGWLRDMDEYFPVDYVRSTKEEEFLKLVRTQNYYQYDEDGLSEPDDDSLAFNPRRLLDAIRLTVPGSGEERRRMLGLIPYRQNSGIPEAAQGEWEAYKYSAPRGVSFKHLMEHIYRVCIASFRYQLN